MGNKKKNKSLKILHSQKPSIKETPITMTPSEDPMHLYMAWDPMFDKDQMYKIRHVLQGQGSAWVAKISVTSGKKPIEEEILQHITSQISEGKETRLYMTNFRSVHVYNIVEVQRKKPEGCSGLIIDTYNNKDFNYELWIKVDDVYILSVDDPDNIHNEVNQTLAELEVVTFNNGLAYKTDKKITPYISSLRYPVPVISENNESYFRIISGLHYREKFGEKWYNTHRCVTKEYKVCSYHLQKNCFPGLWEKLSRPAQHYLIECEMKRIESCYYESSQSFIILRQAWECYILAVVSELYNYLFEDVSPDFKKLASRVTNDYNADFDIGQFFTLVSSLKKDVGHNLGFNEKDKKLRSFLKDCYNSESQVSNNLRGLKEVRNRLQHKLLIPMAIESSSETEFNKIMSLLRSNLMTSMLPIPSVNIFFLLLASREGLSLDNQHTMRTGNSLPNLVSTIDIILGEINKNKRAG